jgi:uncharacterized membrane protein YdjX (TVP38/TMEM64 family)
MKKPYVILAAGAALVAIAWASGVLGTLTEPATLPARIAAAGLWGPLLFTTVALGMFALFMMAPAVWAATVVWPLPLAFSYSFGAGLLASVLTYAAARRLGGEWAQDRIPPSIQRWEERLRAHPFSTILALRVLLWVNPLTDLFAAVAGVPPRTYLLATIFGLLPTTAFQILVGAGGITIAGRLPWWAWGLLAAVLLVGGLAYNRRRRRVAA